MALQQITGQEHGTQFIDKLNKNFANCNTGGDGTLTVKVTMQGGELKAATGYADGKWCSGDAVSAGGSLSRTYTDDDFDKYQHTPCYLSLNGNKVKGVTIPSGSTLSIFCYDEAFTLLSGGVVNDEDDIPESAAYVKMQIYNASGYSQVIALDMTLAAQPEWVKNSFTPLTPQFHNFECKPPKLFDDAACTLPHSLPTGATADVDNTRYHDNGFVMLPPNYDPNGEPCKFVFWFSGDNCAFFIGHSPFIQRNGSVAAASIYETNFKYLNNMGYAVVSCGGYTSMWSGEEGAANASLWRARISPAFVASAKAFYDFLMSNYNFDPMPYTAGKSAGGYMLLYSAAQLPFPVRAASGFSVAVSMASSMATIWLSQQKSWQKRLGCANWDSFSLVNEFNGAADTTIHAKNDDGVGTPTAEEAEGNRLKENVEIYSKYDQFTLISDLNYLSYLEQSLDFNEFASLDATSALSTFLSSGHKVMTTPVKLWCATKDRSVAYSWHKIYTDWVNANNGNAELRSYTGDDGNHFTFCGDGGKVANNLPTPYGGTMNGVNIGIVEAVEWFKRW